MRSAYFLRKPWLPFDLGIIDARETGIANGLMRRDASRLSTRIADADGRAQGAPATERRRRDPASDVRRRATAPKRGIHLRALRRRYRLRAPILFQLTLLKAPHPVGPSLRAVPVLRSPRASASDATFLLQRVRVISGRLVRLFVCCRLISRVEPAQLSSGASDSRRVSG